jgi:hypothetical protein
MSDPLLAAYQAAKTQAREQWHQDLQAARERFDKTVQDAERDYERKRKEQHEQTTTKDGVRG